MNNNRIWVFRLSVGKSGNPESTVCPRVDLKSVSEYREKIIPLEEDEVEIPLEEDLEEIEEIEVIEDGEEYDNDIFNFKFLITELFENGRLRQGWGYEFEDMNLDLNQPGNIWIENFLKLKWRLDGEKIRTKNACGRWNILKRMKEMEIGDIVFIPRIPDESKFTVATVDKRKYFFQPMEEYFRYSHVIGVKNIKKYSYEEHFPAKTFAAYQTAISQIKNHHKIFDLVNGFVEESYL